MAISIRTTLRNSRLDTITTDVGTSGVIRVYDGTPPASANAALAGNTLLATLTCSATFAAAASGGVLTANAITSGTAIATGTASFFRLLRPDLTTVVLQGTVNTSGGDLNLNTLSIATGGPVACTSFVITEANS
jgi:hypothetical protein